MHAPSADLILLVSALGIRPTAIVDTQLLAGFVGLGSGQSLGSLVERALGVRLAKTESYTDWARRPLSQEQLTYAADDVRYLLQLADELQARVQRLGREQWAADEHARRYGPGARFVPDPDEAWRRVKGHGRLSPTDRAVLRSLAAWREREAAERPPGRLGRAGPHAARAGAPARHQPRGHPGGARAAGAPSPGRAGRHPGGDPDGGGGAPIPCRPRRRPRCGHAWSRWSRWARSWSAPARRQPRSRRCWWPRDYIETFLAAALEERIDGHALAAGWRRELVGDALLELAAGRLALGVGGRRPYLAEVPLGDDLGPRAAPADGGAPLPPPGGAGVLGQIATSPARPAARPGPPARPRRPGPSIRARLARVDGHVAFDHRCEGQMAILARRAADAGRPP